MFCDHPGDVVVLMGIFWRSIVWLSVYRIYFLIIIYMSLDIVLKCYLFLSFVQIEWFDYFYWN